MKAIPASCTLQRSLVAAALALLLMGPASALAQNQTISGDLNVTGSLDISGPVFNLGTWNDNPAKLGLNITYSDEAALSFVTTRHPTQWSWLRAAWATDATSVPRMSPKVGGNLEVVKALIIQPQGDLGMGEFTARPSSAS